MTCEHSFYILTKEEFCVKTIGQNSFDLKESFYVEIFFLLIVLVGKRPVTSVCCSGQKYPVNMIIFYCTPDPKVKGLQYIDL